MNRYLLVICFCIISCQLSASSLFGVVYGKGNGMAIGGAIIEIGSLHLKTYSDSKGHFLISNLSGGNYVLTIKAMGYQEDTIPIIMRDSSDMQIAVCLKERAENLQTVVVSDSIYPGSDEAGQLKERVSNALLSIISRESIQRSVDHSMADALERATGVSLSADQTGNFNKAIIRGMDAKYSYTSINGIALPSPDDRSRYLALDLISAYLIDYLEVYKTRTAQMPGSAIGGEMNIVTKKATLAKQFSFNMSTGYSQLFLNRKFLSFDAEAVQTKSPFEKYGLNYYAKGNDFSKDNLYFKKIRPFLNMQGNVLWSNRFFNSKLGIFTEVGLNNSQEGSNGFLIAQNSEPQLHNVPGITDYIKKNYSIQSKNRYAYSHLDYTLNERQHFQLTGLYIDKADAEARDWVDTSLSEGRSGVGTGRITIAQRSRLHQQRLLHLNLQGSHQINKIISFDWSFVYSRAYGNYPDWASLEAGTGRILGADNQIQQTPVLLSPMQRIWLHNTEDEKDVSAKFSYLPKKFSNHLILTFGSLIQYRKRNNFYNEYIFNPAYTTSNGQPFTDIYRAIWYNDNGPQNPLGNTSTPGTYAAKENLSAFFSELDFHLKKMTITAGLREEHTLQILNSAATGTTIDPQTKIKIHYGDWLPSLQFRYLLNRNEAIRFSYYKALSRPALYDITFFNMNYDDYNIAGNPFLKRTKAHNLDIRYELYKPPVLDVLQITAFYKLLKDPYEKTYLNANDTLYPISNGVLPYTPASKMTEQLRNYPSAYNYGFELSATKHFGQFEISGNYTFTSSHIQQLKKYKQREDPMNSSSDIITLTRFENRPLQGQSTNMANIKLSYYNETIGWKAQLTGSYVGRRIQDVSGWYNLDLWQKGSALFHISMQKRLHTHWQLFARISNLLSAGSTFYLKSTAYTNSILPSKNGKLIIAKQNTFSGYILGIQYKL